MQRWIGALSADVHWLGLTAFCSAEVLSACCQTARSRTVGAGLEWSEPEESNPC